jgi:GntR family histidine utilization transcriptional repressor
MKPGPIYERIKESIRGDIDAGKLRPTDRLPTEAALMKTFAASRMTVHRAVRELSAEGLVTRVPGVGSFVNEPAVVSSVLELRDIVEEIRGRGHEHAAKVIVLEEQKASEVVAESLDLPAGHRVFLSKIVHFEGDIPLQLEIKHVNPYVAPDYLQQDFAATSTYGYLQDVSPVSEMEQFIHAILPDEDAQQHLDVGPAVACLLLRRRTWSGRTIATRSRLIYPGNRYYLSSRVQVD